MPPITAGAFRRRLYEADFAQNTVDTYMYAVRDFMARYGTLNRSGLPEHSGKVYLQLLLMAQSSSTDLSASS